MRKKNKILNSIRRGDLLFFKSRGFISSAIRWVTSSDTNHVGVYIDDGLVLESQNDTGVDIRELQYYFNRKGEEIRIGRVRNITEKMIDEIILYGLEKRGLRYDFFGIFGIFLKHMVRKLDLNKVITFYGENKINARRSFWCSEFMGDIFSTQGIEFTDHDISYLTPNEIYNSPIIEKIEENHANI